MTEKQQDTLASLTREVEALESGDDIALSIDSVREIADLRRRLNAALANAEATDNESARKRLRSLLRRLRGVYAP